MKENPGNLSEKELKEVYLSETFETAWDKLPQLLGRLPLRVQLDWRERFQTEIGIKAFVSPWKKILEEVAKKRETYYDSHVLNNSEARLDLMTSGNKYSGLRLYITVLKDMGEMTFTYNGRWDPGRSAEFITALLALKSTLPWNRTGFNDITPGALRLDVAEKARDYIKNL